MTTTREPFETLYARYERRLFGFILAFVKNREDAEEIFHDTFAKYLRAKDEPGEAWLFTVARNACLNHRRRQRRVVALDEIEELRADATVDVAETAARADAVADAVAGLPAALAQVYRLRVAGASYEDIARETNVPLGTVKSRVNALVQRLKKDLRSWIAK